MNIVAKKENQLIPEKESVMEGSWQLSTGTLCHNDVYNHKEQKLGKLQDLMVDFPSGQLFFAVISSGGLWGIGEKLLAVPWQALKLDRDLKRFVLPLSKERLGKAPAFDSDHWPNMGDPAWVADIHSYYDVECKETNTK